MPRNSLSSKESALTPSNLEKLIRDGNPHFFLDVLVTPALAKTILQFNAPGETNRPMHRRGVEAAIMALKEGCWENTGEPIIISDTNLLNDGQHRLQAVVESDLPAIMDIRMGVKRSAFAQTNSGMKRQASEALRVSGYSYHTKLAATARFVMAYEKGLPNAAYMGSDNGRVVAAVKRWPDMVDAMIYPSILGNRLWTAATSSLGFFAYRTANEATIRGFFEVLQTGEGKADNPPHRLREAILHRRVGNATADRVRDLAWCILAWNAYLAGSKMSTIRWTPVDKFPQVNGLEL